MRHAASTITMANMLSEHYEEIDCVLEFGSSGERIEYLSPELFLDNMISRTPMGVYAAKYSNYGLYLNSIAYCVWLIEVGFTLSLVSHLFTPVIDRLEERGYIESEKQRATREITFKMHYDRKNGD